MTSKFEIIPLDPGTEKPRLIIDPTNPLPGARRFLEAHFMADSVCTFRYYRGDVYVWNGRCYEALDERTVRAKVYELLESTRAQRRDGPVPYKPTKTKVTNFLDALMAAANLPASVEAPLWLEPDHVPDLTFAPRDILACNNGLLHLPTLELLPPTPLYFNCNATDVAYNADAPEPANWLLFLKQLWADDTQSVETLQELFGYFLTPDTRQQKIAIFIGPKRSGKGTIARVITRVLGSSNVCAPTLGGLGQNFGMAPLIGKSLAIISDARVGGRADQHVIAERLLSISGEDLVTIDRKFREPWTGQLTTRFLVLTNETPRVADASGALASRFILLRLNRSFYGREDHGLAERLLTEREGILNWAIGGWQRLKERGYFEQPDAGRELLEELETLGSPVAAFVRDKCTLGPDMQVEKSVLYTAYKDWCENEGRKALAMSNFGRDLHAAVPALSECRPHEGEGVRARYYTGIDLAQGI